MTFTFDLVEDKPVSAESGKAKRKVNKALVLPTIIRSWMKLPMRFGNWIFGNCGLIGRFCNTSLWTLRSVGKNAFRDSGSKRWHFHQSSRALEILRPAGYGIKTVVLPDTGRR